MESNNILLCVLNYLKGQDSLSKFTDSIFLPENSEKLMVFEYLCVFYFTNAKEYLKTLKEQLKITNEIEIDYSL